MKNTDKDNPARNLKAKVLIALALLGSAGVVAGRPYADKANDRYLSAVERRGRLTKYRELGRRSNELIRGEMAWERDMNCRFALYSTHPIFLNDIEAKLEEIKDLLKDPIKFDAAIEVAEQEVVQTRRNKNIPISEISWGLMIVAWLGMRVNNAAKSREAHKAMGRCLDHAPTFNTLDENQRRELRKQLIQAMHSEEYKGITEALFGKEFIEYSKAVAEDKELLTDKSAGFLEWAAKNELWMMAVDASLAAANKSRGKK